MPAGTANQFLYSLRNPNPVEFPLVVSHKHHRLRENSHVLLPMLSKPVMQLPEFFWVWVSLIFIHNFPAFM